MNDEELMAGMAGVVKDYVARATVPLLERINKLEAELATRPSAEIIADIVARNAMALAASMPKPADGKDGTSVVLADVLASVLPTIELRTSEAAIAAFTRKDGSVLEAEDVRGMIEKAVAAIPKPENGKDGAVGPMGPPGAQGEAGDAGPQGVPGVAGEKGADAILPDVEAIVADAVQRAVSIIPKAIDGKDGKDGRDGLAGVPGRDGMAGKDGVDGFQLEDFGGKYVDGRILELSLRSGDRELVRGIKLPGIIEYKGVFKTGQKSEEGDCVTHSGSAWIALRDTDGIPGKSSDWQLAVKRGS